MNNQNKTFATNSLFYKSFLLSLFFFGFYFTAQANILNVGPNQNYLTITGALDVANAGDTINIFSGVYNESVFINKAVSLVGVGTEKPILSGSGFGYIVKVENTNGVTIDNLEINGSPNNNLDYGIFVNNAGVLGDAVVIKNSTIKNIWNSKASAISTEGNSYIIISKNNISSFSKNGLRFIGSKGKVEGNTITGDTVDGISRVLNLINLRNGADVEIDNNILSYALTATPSLDTHTSACIFVNAYMDGLASNANIHDNDISSCDVGVLVTSKLVDTDYSSAQLANNNFHDLNQNTFLEKNTGILKIIDNTPISNPIAPVIIETPKEIIPIIETPTTIETPKEIVSVAEIPKEEVVLQQESVTEPIILNVEEKIEPVVNTPEVPVVEGEQLSASVLGSVLSLGTGNLTIGFLFAIMLIILLGHFLSKKHS